MRVDKIIEIAELRIKETENQIAQNNESQELKKRLEKLITIKEILTEDNAIFLKIPKEKAYGILIELINKDQIEEVHLELTSPAEYKELKNNFKI